MESIDKSMLFGKIKNLPSGIELLSTSLIATSSLVGVESGTLIISTVSELRFSRDSMSILWLSIKDFNSSIFKSISPYISTIKFFGKPREIRTPTFGFGDRCSTVDTMGLLEPGVGIEPTLSSV
jgi:hypothetical protein